MRIAARLRLIWILSLGMVGLLALSIAWSYSEESRAYRDVELAAEMREIVFERMLVRDEYLLYEVERAKQQWVAKNAKLRELASRARERATRPDDLALLAAVQRCVEETAALFSSIVRGREEGDPSSLRPRSSEWEKRQVSQLFLKAYNLQELIGTLQASSFQRAVRAHARAKLVLVSFVVLMGGVVVVIAWVTGRSVTARIRTLHEAAAKIGSGDLDHRVPALGKDELSELARATNEMASKLKESYASREQLRREVEERTRAEEALRVSEERFKIAAESLSDVIYEWDVGDRVDWFGDVDGLMGFAPGEFPRTLAGWGATLHPDDRDRVMAAVERQLRGEAPYDVEYRILRKDGTYTWWKARGTVVHDAAGKAERWIGAITDVGERKRAEEALRESEHRFRGLIEALPILTWTCTPEGPCDYLSPQWVKYTGIPEPEQLGYGWLGQLHPDDRERTITLWQAEAPRGQGFDLEFRIRRADGAYRWFKTRAAPLRDAQGRLTKWFGSNTDVDDMKQTEDELASTLEDLKRSNTELEQFAYVASHDLQEPLRMVSSFTQLLAQRYRGKLDADADEFIAFAVDGANRMQRLISDLLTFSRVGRRGKPPAPTDSHAALGQARVNLAMAIGESGALVTSDDLPLVLADEAQLVLVFQNLVGNAIKFRRPGDSPRVHVSAGREGRMWVFRVRDNGIGIAADYRPRLFTIFQRLHTRDEYPGTGIGLAICKRIVDRHGGQIGFESEPGVGSTFFFTLPEAGGTAS